MFLAPLGTLPFTDEAARAAGVIRRELERAGTPIGAYDTPVAGQALQRGLILVTANGAESQRIGGWENWHRDSEVPRALARDHHVPVGGEERRIYLLGAGAIATHLAGARPTAALTPGV